MPTHTHLLAGSLLAALHGCAGWNQLPTQGITGLEGALWDARAPVPTVDGLYVRLPHAGSAVLLPSHGKGSSYRAIDVDGGTIRQLVAAPDHETVLAFVDRATCDGDGKRAAEGCPEEEQEIRTDLVVLRGGRREATLALQVPYNALAFADDGRHAIAYLDFDDPSLVLHGVVDLTSVVVIDLEAGTSTPVSVGFAADHVLFDQTAGAAAQRAVVLSQNEVGVIDLSGSTPAVDTTFPLTIDADDVVTPVGVQLTPDGRQALISVRETPDLYALDLENHSFNIVELSAAPSSMLVHQVSDRSVFVSGTQAVVDVVEHAYLDVTTFQLDEPMQAIAAIEEAAVLWGTDQRDVYRLDLGTDELVEYRLENPALQLHIAPGERFAIVLTRAESGVETGSVKGLYDAYPGMEILDLEGKGSQPFVLEGTGLGVAFAEASDALYALVLQKGVDYLYQLDLYTGQATTLDLAAPPVAIGDLPDERFWITHDAALGLVSILDPETGELTEISGFAAHDILSPTALAQTRRTP